MLVREKALKRLLNFKIKKTEEAVVAAQKELKQAQQEFGTMTEVYYHLDNLRIHQNRVAFLKSIKDAAEKKTLCEAEIYMISCSGTKNGEVCSDEKCEGEECCEGKSIFVRVIVKNSESGYSLSPYKRIISEHSDLARAIKSSGASGCVVQFWVESPKTGKATKNKARIISCEFPN